MFFIIEGSEIPAFISLIIERFYQSYNLTPASVPTARIYPFGEKVISNISLSFFNSTSSSTPSLVTFHTFTMLFHLESKY